MEQIGRHLYGEVRYERSYDMDTGRYNCTCPSAQYGKECKHIKKWKPEVEQRLKDMEVFV